MVDLGQRRLGRFSSGHHDISYHPGSYSRSQGEWFERAAQPGSARQLHPQLDEYQCGFVQRIEQLERRTGNQWIPALQQRGQRFLYVHPHLHKPQRQRQ